MKVSLSILTTFLQLLEELLHHFYMPLEDFEIAGELGKGTFGSVVKCMRRSDGEIYAMKQIKLQKLKEKDKTNALNEVRFLASIHSPYVVEYKEAFYDEPSEKLCIVMEYANGGDLQSKIKKAIATKTRIPQNEIWSVAYHCLEGLQKLHSANIIHRDIKPANIFFHNSVAKIGDLNVAKHLKDPFTITQTGTPYYASPEVWSEQPYNCKSDIWSLGCVLYEMAMHKPPFRADSPDRLYKKIMTGDYQKVGLPYSKQLSAFINTLMTHSQKKRPDTKELLCHTKMLDMKCQAQSQEVQNSVILKTIQFPKDLGLLNDHLPKPKYDLSKSKSTKMIQLSPVLSFKSSNNLPNLNNIPVKSMKNLPIDANVMRSEKVIGLNPIHKNISIRELIAARRPKVMNKVGSQKLIF